LVGNLPGLLREDDEHGLRDFLRQMRVAHLKSMSVFFDYMDY
jgi:hypothetical protein